MSIVAHVFGLFVSVGVWLVRSIVRVGIAMRVVPSRFVYAVRDQGEMCSPYHPLMIVAVTQRSVDSIARVMPRGWLFCVGVFVVAMRVVAVKPRMIGMMIALLVF